jgi:ribosome biogenesis GTPase
VHLVSARTGAGVAELSQLLKGGVSAFVGHSGVGKSSLLNRLAAEKVAATGAVSKSRSKGTHTTSASQLYELPGEIRIIDTPGIRELALEETAEACVEIAFPEIERLAESCRLRDCSHTHEPDCAVKGAVERGEVSALRYTSYRRLRDGGNAEEPGAKDRGAHADNAPEWTCTHCRRTVGQAAPGTENRNHCPYCLWSVHVDNRPGDRKAFCKGDMEPITVWVRDGEWVIIHRCTTCGSLHGNRIAGDDNEALLLSLAVRPLASPPFSLEGVGRG